MWGCYLIIVFEKKVTVNYKKEDGDNHSNSTDKYLHLKELRVAIEKSRKWNARI